MANDRTFLSFVRSSLYFVVAGLTLNQLVSIQYGNTIAVSSYATGGVLFIAGVYKYVRQLKRISESRRNIDE
jgi:putative membrane protein